MSRHRWKKKKKKMQKKKKKIDDDDDDKDDNDQGNNKYLIDNEYLMLPWYFSLVEGTLGHMTLACLQPSHKSLFYGSSLQPPAPFVLVSKRSSAWGWGGGMVVVVSEWSGLGWVGVIRLAVYARIRMQDDVFASCNLI